MTGHREGYGIGGQLYGYDLDPDHKGQLRVNDREAQAVRKMFEVYLEEKSINKTADRLNAMGFRTKAFTSRRDTTHEAREFAYSTVRTILMNLAYLGKKEINKKKQDLDQIGTRQTTLKPVETRLEQISSAIEQLEQEVAEKQAEIEDLQKSKADPKRIAANLKSFGDIYEGLGAGDRQLLVGLMVKRIRIAPTRIELELYDHSPVIEDWSKGEKDGWFRTRVSWLPSPMSNGTTIWVGVDVDVWGFEGVFREVWGETARRVVQVVLAVLVGAHYRRPTLPGILAARPLTVGC